MHSQTMRVATVAITSFIPWLITLAALGAASSLPRLAFIVIHYLIVALLFGVAFGIYYKEHKGVDPFVVTVTALLCLFVYEFIYITLFSDGSRWFLTYTDWLVPVFLIASTIYWTGTFFSKP